jgi:hypothetical protein
MAMSGKATRKGALLNSGTLSPNPWDLTLLGQNVWPKLEGTRTEDKAPQGCDPSAALSAGMAGAASMESSQIQTTSAGTKAYSGQKMVLTEGPTLDLYRSQKAHHHR